MAAHYAKAQRFKRLTLSELLDWAGTTLLSEAKQFRRQVKALAYTPTGILVAWVEERIPYATRVDIQNDGQLSAECSCGHWGPCKHAVAVILEYLEQVRRNQEIPTVTDQTDPRLLPQLTHLTPDKQGVSQEVLHRYLLKQTQEQLIDLLVDIIQQFPEVESLLRDRYHLADGAIDKLLSDVRAEIEQLGRPSPLKVNLTQLRTRLETVLTQGYADKIVRLGKILLKAGGRQVETDHEGNTALEIAECMNVVFQALSQSALSTVEQMLWVIDIQRLDEYDLCHQNIDRFWQHHYAPAQWSQLADMLINRLKRAPTKPNHFKLQNHRDRLIQWAITALEQSTRHKEIIPLCQSQVEYSPEGYTRLVNYLLKMGRRQEAEQWIQRGIAVTQKESSGIARRLRDIFLDIQKNSEHWDQVAALQADEFFNTPSLYSFQSLQQAAKQAGVYPEVRAAALHYLETGEYPSTTTEHPWPLPQPALTLPPRRYSKNFPDTHTLISIAIDEKHAEMVMYWYNRQKKLVRSEVWSEILDSQVARAIAEHYPDKAVEIYKRIVEKLIAVDTTKAYQQLNLYLTEIQQLLQKHGQDIHWNSYLTELRQRHGHKRRLLKTVDELLEKHD